MRNRAIWVVIAALAIALPIAAGRPIGAANSATPTFSSKVVHSHSGDEVQVYEATAEDGTYGGRAFVLYSVDDQHAVATILAPPLEAHDSALIATLRAHHGSTITLYKVIIVDYDGNSQQPFHAAGPNPTPSAGCVWFRCDEPAEPADVVDWLNK